MIRIGFGLEQHQPGYLELHTAFLDRYEAGVAVETTLFEGMDELLRSLEARGIPWGIVTNKSGRLTVPLVAQLTFPVPPACVVAGDTTPHAKPHPAPLLHAAESIGVDARQIVYVGDDVRAIEAGRAAGMPTVAARKSTRLNSSHAPIS